MIIFIHHENVGNNKKYIIFNENTYYTIFKQKRKKTYLNSIISYIIMFFICRNMNEACIFWTNFGRYNYNT